MSSLTAMAEAILAQAKDLDAQLASHKLAPPSFHEDTLDALPGEVQDKRWALANACNEMKKLTRGAAMGTMDTALNWTDALGLRIVYHYKLAHAVPLDGSASYAEIAAASELEESLCRRFLRLAMGSNICEEDPTTQRVRHTAASRRLVTDAGLSDAVGLHLEDIAPSASKLIDVWDKYGQEIGEPDKSAFCVYNETDKTVFGLLASQPERMRRFGGAMGFFTKGDTWDLRHILNSFEWSSIDRPGDVVVDVGGGNGQISQYLARHTTHTRFIVQDLPHVVPHAREMLPTELKDRIEFVTHDFFTPQPEHPPPAAFLLRYILHDWSTKYAAKILQGLIPAMRRGTKVLIYEYVLEDKPITELSARFGFQMDGIMATFFNSQERTAKEYEQLLHTADKRFVVDAVRRPEGSTMSVVEVSWWG